MNKRISPILLCVSLMTACDAPTGQALPDSSQGEQAPGIHVDAAPQEPAPQAPVPAQPAQDQEVQQQQDLEAAQAEEEAQVVPEVALEVFASDVEPPAVHKDADQLFFSLKAPGKDLPKLKQGPFLPHTKALWLSLQPGTDRAVLELAVLAKDLRFLPERDGHKVMMLDVDGKGNFKEHVLKQIKDPKAPGKIKGLGKLAVLQTAIHIDVGHVTAILREHNKRRRRQVTDFVPGTPEVATRHKVPHVDVEGFLAGKKIDLSFVGRMSPLSTLGARPVLANREHSLLISDLRVIDDKKRTLNPCDAPSDEAWSKIWSFPFLMREMAKESGMSTNDFVESWLASWNKTQKIWSKDGILLDEISDKTGAAMQRRVINDWRKRSKGDKLDLRIAPFRLLSIVYRPDLAKTSPLLDPKHNNAGELRFVFGMMKIRDLNGDGDAHDFFETCNSVEASVIFEYEVPAQGCQQAKNWANEMLHLSEVPMGSKHYLDDLARLSYAVVRSGAAPHKPNKSAIAQVRTNEIEFSRVWQLREFKLDGETGRLMHTTVKETPRHHASRISRSRNTPSPVDLHGSDVVHDEIHQNMEMILDGRYTMPEVAASGAPLLGGAPTFASPFGRMEDRRFRDHKERAARFSIGVNSCDGCHTAETGTLFYHIFPARPGRRPRFSNYLKNSPHVTTHLNSRLQLERHTFDETVSRVQALYGLANQVCSIADKGLVPVQMMQTPLKRQHGPSL